MNNTANDPAFPILDPSDNSAFSGLSKREYTAIMAMQGLLHSDIFRSAWQSASLFEFTVGLAEAAVAHADRLIEQLEKPAEKPHNSPKQPTT